MKSEKIKKRIKRRKAKSVRAIKAFWAARAKTSYQCCVNAYEDLCELEAEPVIDGNYYGHDALISEATPKNVFADKKTFVLATVYSRI